jgi:hypothetical protein
VRLVVGDLRTLLGCNPPDLWVDLPLRVRRLRGGGAQVQTDQGTLTLTQSDLEAGRDINIECLPE